VELDGVVLGVDVHDIVLIGLNLGRRSLDIEVVDPAILSRPADYTYAGRDVLDSSKQFIYLYCRL
jgi:hypothetical protein